MTKALTFMEAVSELERGCRVSRLSWPKGESIEATKFGGIVLKGKTVPKRFDWYPTLADFKSDDWIIGPAPGPS